MPVTKIKSKRTQPPSDKRVQNPPARETRRLFLALWPEIAERQTMASLVENLEGGRKISPENLHLTLFFLGNTSAERLACLMDNLQGIEVPPLTLLLDRLGYWPRSRILWLGTSQTPLSLEELVTTLNRRLAACGYKPEQRPFRAHITLARKFPGPPAILKLAEPIGWPIDHIALVESVNQKDGGHYQVLHRWPED